MRLRWAPGRKPESEFYAAAVIAVVLLAGSALYLMYFKQDRPAIAVLPFSDYSPGGAEQYRADGITEDITQALSQSRRLRVVARTSSSQFGERAPDIREIGRRLGVETIVEGSVQRSGDRYRIAVRLVNARDGFDIWSGTQVTDGSGLEEAERAIARELARALEVDLPKAGPSHAPPPEAQDLLLRARYLAGRGGGENRKRAVEQYERAIALDPEYPRAWGELARVLSLDAFHDPGAAPRLAPDQIGGPSSD